MHEELEESEESEKQTTLGKIERNKVTSENDRSKNLSKKDNQPIGPANEAQEDSKFEMFYRNSYELAVDAWNLGRQVSLSVVEMRNKLLEESQEALVRVGRSKSERWFLIH